jgi:hypothetical protein
LLSQCEVHHLHIKFGSHHNLMKMQGLGQPITGITGEPRIS